MITKRCHMALLLGTVMVLGGCSASQDAELAEAVKAASGMGKARHLQRSCFYIIHPNGQPSDFIGYLFSDLGAAEWPIALDPIEAEGMKAAGITPLPETVRLSPGQRQYLTQKELVLTGDDAKGAIEIVGYLANETQPNLAATFTLATTTPDEFAQQLCQSALESGIEPGIRPETDLDVAPVPAPAP
ncbi:MAG: hypothetical protein AAGG51_10490 [Cyanobacteria bacterium P01_G01_bin.54]